MNSVGDVLSRKERPAWVTFVRVPVQDHEKTKETGHYVAKDVDYAHITPPYSKDVYKQKVKDWFATLEADMSSGRIPPEWVQGYKRAYDSWKSGQEIPLDGTPIKGWQILSPAMQETLVNQGIRTVEDLAAINDEGVRRLGMGGMQLKSKANSWLASAQNAGKVAIENAELKQRVGMQAEQISAMQTQIRELSQRLNVTMNLREEVEEITADDIIEPAPKRGPGRPRKGA